ncbi:MAG: hypothetical protein JW993_13695 [Sedimentisphaerales bacterium]|nr:hypothetical protein [Sedimentisphaerales bacterium]
MHRLQGLGVLALLVSMVFFAGCAGRLASTPGTTLHVGDVNAADVVGAARTVLSRMSFAIDKADPNAGIVRTKPLAAAQFFEVWRSDNTSLADGLEANLHSVRRSVELDFARDRGQWRIDCTVRVQRLSVPGEEVASVSQAYRIHSRSDPDLQTFVLTPAQRAQMTWIDLDNDEALAAVILQRIEKQLTQRRGEEEAS